MPDFLVYVIYVLYICYHLYNKKGLTIGIMDAVIDRKQTAFRLSSDLLEKLREAATRENRSLNNYVESVLMDVVYNNPNKLTIKATREARESRDLETLNTDNIETLIDSL